MKNQYTAMVNGHKVTLITDHARAVAAIRAAGYFPPVIPDGYNTDLLGIRLPGGEPALAINQTGFQRIRADNEEQVNGITLVVLDGQAAMDDATAERTLTEIYRVIETAPVSGQ